MIMMTAMYGDKQCGITGDYGDKQCGNTGDYDDSNVWGQTMWQH